MTAVAPQDADPDALLSVLLHAPRGSDAALRLTLESLRAQTVHARLEVLLLVPQGAHCVVEPSAAAAFAAVRAIAVDGDTSLAQRLAAGVREARAPLVTFAGNHSYPEATWAA